MTYSILEEARRAGYKQGREDERDYQSQLSMCRYDEAHYKGYLEGTSEAPSRALWFLVGVTLTNVAYWFL